MLSRMETPLPKSDKKVVTKESTGSEVALRDWRDTSWKLLAAAFGTLYAVGYAVAIGPYLKGRGRDFEAFYHAAADMLAGRDIYDPSNGRYIYPPLVAFLFQPLAWLSMPKAAVIWLAIVTVALAALALLVVDELFGRLGLRDSTNLGAGENSAERQKTVFWAVALLGSVLTSKAIYAEIWLGQTDVFLLLAFVLALRWLDRRPVLAGIALGLAANVKYLSLIFLPYFLIRRRWRSAAATVVAFVAGLFIPALSTGLQRNLDDQKLVFGVLNRVTGVKVGTIPQADIGSLTWDHSVSISSAAARLAGALGMPEGAGQKAIVAAVALLVLAGVLWGLWRAYRAAGLRMFRPAALDVTPEYERAVVLEWAALLTLAMALSPQTTTRHMVLLLPVNLLVAAALLLPRPGIKTRALLVVSVLLLIGMTFPPAKLGLQAWRNIGGVSWLSVAVLWLVIPTTMGFRAGLSSPARPPVETP